jgi:peroxiredoxin
MLDAIRQTLDQALNDRGAANRVADRIRQVDPSWYPQRSVVTFFGPSNLSGVWRNDPLTGRAFALVLGEATQLDAVADPADRLVRLQALLEKSPTAVATRFIRERIFEVAEQAGDTGALIADGDVLRQLDPTDAALPARMALALAKTGASRQALRYAEVAAGLTAGWHPIDRPPNTDADLFAERCPESTQRRIFNRQRALALEAKGQILCQLGECAQAESMLRESVSLDRSDRNLARLAEVLRKLDRPMEADGIAAEAEAEFAVSVRRQLINEPAEGFQLKTIHGQTITLEALKGKAVLISFWATYCGPCRVEMPRFAELYRRAAPRGLEILGVTLENPTERQRIDDFVQKHGLPFPILYADGLDQRYRVIGLPTVVAIDRHGKVRYRAEGFHDETMRALEVVVAELLK